jgi:hypothetical protein
MANSWVEKREAKEGWWPSRAEINGFELAG